MDELFPGIAEALLETALARIRCCAGVGGTVKITLTFAAILRRKNGKCNFANSAQPVSQYQSITGSGSASFSSRISPGVAP